MEIEMNRVASFAKCSQTSPLTLARCGFWYTGNGDAVECFSCKIRFTAKDENPVEKHLQRSPQCEFLRSAAYNKPMAVADSSHLAWLMETATQEESRRGSTVADCASVGRHDTLNIEPANGADLLDTLRAIYSAAHGRATKNGVIPAKIDRSRPDYELLKIEETRLRTFYDWPGTANPRPAELAREGFYYTGTADRVQCAFCKGVVKAWNPSDVASVEHRKHYPSCPFVRGLEVGNVAIGSRGCMTAVDRAGDTIEEQMSVATDEQQTMRNSTGNLIRESCLSSQTNQPLEYIPSEEPKHPAYRTYSARLESFRRGIVGEGQTAEGLADAGWFHVGPNDKVRCFQCGGNLRDWETGDDPWVEHKRWYDYCPYTKVHRPEPRPRAPEIQVLTIPSTIGSYRIEPREVKARMDTPTVRAILDMGYSRDKVKAVIETRLSTTGDDFTSAESLLEALFQLEEATADAQAAQTGATASSLTSAVSNNSIYSSNYTASSTSSRSSGYSSGSSSASATLLQTEVSPMPVGSSSGEVATSSAHAKASTSYDSKTASLKPESAALTTIPETAQSKAKGKKKKNKKRKPASAAAASSTEPSAADGGDEMAGEGANEGAQNDQEKTIDEEQSLEEIPDEEASKWLEENRQLRDQRTCKVCMDAEVNTVFLPCGHLVCCATCSPHLRNCPICRTFIRGTVKTFLS